MLLLQPCTLMEEEEEEEEEEGPLHNPIKCEVNYTFVW
jgi:hypothetical protein